MPPRSTSPPPTSAAVEGATPLRSNASTGNKPLIPSSAGPATAAAGGGGEQREGIRVAVRVRPFLPHESGSNSCVSVNSRTNQISIGKNLVGGSDGADANANGGEGESGGKNRKTFTFDHALPQHLPQHAIYSTCVSTLISSCLEGYNATTLAYGQTGAGKTYTILGPSAASAVGVDDEVAKEVGIIPRALGELFGELERRKCEANGSAANGEAGGAADDDDDDDNNGEAEGEEEKKKEIRDRDGDNDGKDGGSSSFEYKVRLQFLELYGEEIRDLLVSGPTGGGAGASSRDLMKGGGKKKNSRASAAASSAGGGGAQKLTIRDTKSDCEVLGATTVPVQSAEDALLCLTRGMLRRVTGATAMNAESSRSHAIMTVLVEQTTRLGEEEGNERVVTKSKFNFVDLAGSERAKRTGAKGTRLKEGIDINKGLLVLGNVISALASIDPNKKGSSKASFVPFRDSKLTRLLRGSLGGNHKTLLIACVSPSSRNLEESLNCLRYANRAKNIKNSATKHVDDSGSSKLIAELRGQVGMLAAELLRVRRGGDPEGGAGGTAAAFTLEQLEQLSSGVAPAKRGGGGRGDAGAKRAPPQAAATNGGTVPAPLKSGSEEDGGDGGSGGDVAKGGAAAAAKASSSFSAVESSDGTDELEKTRSALDRAERDLATNWERLAEVTAERDELRRRLEVEDSEDRRQQQQQQQQGAAGTASELTGDDGGETDGGGSGKVALDEGTMVAIVERIVSFQRDLEDDTERRWAERMTSDGIISEVEFDADDQTDDGTAFRDDDSGSISPPAEGTRDRRALDVASGLYSTGLFLVECEAYEDSLPCFQVALEIRREQYGWDDPSVGDVLYMEGLVRACTRDHDRALILLYDALRIRKNASDLHNVASTLRTIGDLHVSKKEYMLADMFYEECLQSAAECNDDTLPDIWLSLAKVKKKIGQRQESLDCLEEVLAIWKKTVSDDQKWEFGPDGILRRRVGPEERQMASLLYEIGVLALQLGGNGYARQVGAERSKGEEALLEFIQIREAEGADMMDAKVANACYTLGNFYASRKEGETARTYWARALEIYQFVGLPDDHPHVVALKELSHEKAWGPRLISRFRGGAGGDVPQHIHVVSDTKAVQNMEDL